MNKLKTFLDNELIDYTIMEVEDSISVLLFYLPYQPFMSVDKEIAHIDAYYTASNKLYFQTLDLIIKLNELGYISKMSMRPLKAIAYESGLGYILRNTLIAVDKFGTKIALMGIDIEGSYNIVRPIKDNMICEKCNICVRECPTNALDIGFDRVKCIRHHQDFTYITDANIAKVMGNSVLGCDKCQDKCPFNKEVEHIAMPVELYEIMKLENFLEVIKGGRKAIAVIQPYIGANYNRPRRLLALTLNACSNASGKFLDIIQEYAEYPNEDIQKTVKRILDKK